MTFEKYHCSLTRPRGTSLRLVKVLVRRGNLDPGVPPSGAEVRAGGRIRHGSAVDVHAVVVKAFHRRLRGCAAPDIVGSLRQGSYSRPAQPARSARSRDTLRGCPGRCRGTWPRERLTGWVCSRQAPVPAQPYGAQRQQKRRRFHRSSLITKSAQSWAEGAMAPDCLA